MTELKRLFRIKNGSIDFQGDGFEDLISQFAQDNDGKRGELIYKIVEDSVRHHQFKYYYGYLLKDVALSWGERDETAVDLFLKRRFLYQTVISGRWEDIPKKVVGRCIVILKDENTVAGYVPSKATLSHKEMHAFILQVEDMLFHDIGGELRPQSIPFRKVALGIDPYQMEIPE